MFALEQVLEETDNDSEDDWTPAARLTPTPRASPVARRWARGSSEEAASGSGDRVLLGGSNTTSSLPARSSPSSEDAPDLTQMKRQQLETKPPIANGETASSRLESPYRLSETSWECVDVCSASVKHQVKVACSLHH